MKRTLTTICIVLSALPAMCQIKSWEGIQDKGVEQQDFEGLNIYVPAGENKINRIEVEASGKASGKIKRP